MTLEADVIAGTGVPKVMRVLASGSERGVLAQVAGEYRSS